MDPVSIIMAGINLTLGIYDRWSSSVTDAEQAALDIRQLERAIALAGTQSSGLSAIWESQRGELESQIADIESQLEITRAGAAAQSEYVTGQLALTRASIGAESQYVRESTSAAIAESKRQTQLGVMKAGEAGSEALAGTQASAAASGLTGAGSIMATSRRIMDVTGREMSSTRAAGAYQQEETRRAGSLRLTQLGLQGKEAELSAGYQLGQIARGLSSAEITAAGAARGLAAQITQGDINLGMDLAALQATIAGATDELEYLQGLGFSRDMPELSTFERFLLGRP